MGSNPRNYRKIPRIMCRLCDGAQEWGQHRSLFAPNTFGYLIHGLVVIFVGEQVPIAIHRDL